MLGIEKFCRRRTANSGYVCIVLSMFVRIYCFEAYVVTMHDSLIF